MSDLFANVVHVLHGGQILCPKGDRLRALYWNGISKQEARHVPLKRHKKSSCKTCKRRARTLLKKTRKKK